ncbi:uncharacterized protein KNAG_0D04330 [Huiozyma naganishii CBS 8797]|uniref:AB hydrolase-1 domain-containing protein n=1 Tax=Huiozyma naganishii (strain ATCC MYA-139 / BCRC 22969 / CBS 8797 / KCTC 17520 / NBRC 10181 / NCYC 3082 / Yp74L-3) TaxID=1071383 RepID=J7S631_HUIN7|nr:hypothetical protein KNAG_0D04330 [Kazachstania naganishii CBS 8797]CCK70179.1 hypothetical protein KNAG_0D04330 [Kazachstania naganishii CBS 8797]
MTGKSYIEADADLSYRKVSGKEVAHLVLEDNEDFVFIRSKKYHKGNGLGAIISWPEITHPNTVTQTVILVHGHLSHKNAIYQPDMAAKLSSLGYCVIRFDFRNQGDSEDNRDALLGRTLPQDFQDLDTIVRSLSAKRVYRGLELSLAAVIAHSRGVLVMFHYFNEHNRQRVPLLVNCCGRFGSAKILERYDRVFPSWRGDHGFTAKTFRFGQYTDYWVSEAEIMSTAQVDTRQFTRLDHGTKVLLIYCQCDAVIPESDGIQYRNMFRLAHYDTNFCEIPFADHNFYGLPGDKNSYGLPLKRNKVNYASLVLETLLPHLPPQMKPEKRTPPL